MRLTRKLVDWLNRAFDRASRQVLAFRLNYAGTSMTWLVEDNILYTMVAGGPGSDLVVDLTAYTIGSLVTYLEAQSGYTVPYVDGSGEVTGLAATVLIDGNGDQGQSNGDHLYSYTSVLWAFMEPIAVELKAAADEIDQMLLQMTPQTASGEWLDVLGSYYGVDRLAGETDDVYALRIPLIGRPAGNNVALEMAINTITNGLLATVTDSPVEAFTIPFSGFTGTSYGLFDVVYSIDLGGSDDINFYAARVTAIVEALRDAGTHMKSIKITGDLADTYDMRGRATDAMSALNIGFGDFLESAAFVVYHYDATYHYDGTITYGSRNEQLILTQTIGGVDQPPETI